MSDKIWSDDAWADYLYRQTQDKKTLFLSQSAGRVFYDNAIIICNCTNECNSITSLTSPHFSIKNLCQCTPNCIVLISIFK